MQVSGRFRPCQGCLQLEEVPRFHTQVGIKSVRPVPSFFPSCLSVSPPGTNLAPPRDLEIGYISNCSPPCPSPLQSLNFPPIFIWCDAASVQLHRIRDVHAATASTCTGKNHHHLHHHLHHGGINRIPHLIQPLQITQIKRRRGTAASDKGHKAAKFRRGSSEVTCTAHLRSNLSLLGIVSRAKPRRVVLVSQATTKHTDGLCSVQTLNCCLL